MKALPLWQPWASLVCLGAKRVETRHWPAPAWVVGRRIAIHACVTPKGLVLCHEEPFNEYIPDPRGLPTGALFCTVVVDRCREITQAAGLELHERNWHEFAFGDYTPGRFAWVLRDVQPFDMPIPWKGSQGIFDVPDDLVGAAPRQEALL